MTGTREAERQRAAAMHLLVMVFGAAVATSLIWTDPWSSTIVVVLFVWAMWVFYRTEPLFLYLALPFVFYWSWCAASIRYLEGGAYISEQFRNGELTGATPRFTLLAMTFLGVVLLCTKGMVRSRKLADPYTSADRPARAQSFTKLAVTLAWTVVAALLITGVVYGFPLLTGEARFSYWPKTPGLERIAYFAPCAALILGVAQHLGVGRRAVIALLAVIGVLFLFSDKFSGPLTCILYFSIGYFTARALNPQTADRRIGVRRVVLVAPLVAALLVGTTAYGYMALSGKSGSEVQQAITDRALGLQGHVYWGVDRREVVEHTDTVQAKDFFRPNHEPIEPAGLEQLMYEVSPPSFAYSMRQAGIRFTNGYPAIAVAAFGYIGALGVQIAAGLLYAMFAFYLALKIARLDFVGLVLGGVFLANIVTNVLVMGEIYYVYKPLALVLLAAMFLEHMLSTAGIAQRERAERREQNKLARARLASSR